MCTSNNQYVMAKPNDPSDILERDSSPRKRGKFDFMFLDCCAFVGVGLGLEDDIAPCASIALLDSEDGAGSISEDSFTRADLSMISQDNLTFDASLEKDEFLKHDDDTKTANTDIVTISTLTMEKTSPNGKVLRTKEDDEEFPSKLILLSANLVTGDKHYPDDEEESKTFNTLSTSRIPPSLDTKTQEITPSLDTKTLDKTLEGMKLIELTVGETEENKGKNMSNPSFLQERNSFDIERVPSLVDASNKDEESVVSAMSAEDESLLSKDKGAATKEPVSKRLFKGKRKMLRPWSWKNKKRASEDQQTMMLPSELRGPLGIVPFTNRQFTSRTEPPRLPASLKNPPLSSSVRQLVPSPGRLPKRPTEAYRKTVPAIKQTKSNDVTASTIATDEDNNCNRYGENVPFDEPHACSARRLPIEKVRVGQYLRPSSRVEIGEI